MFLIGGIFDYPFAAMIFEAMTIAFIATYGLAFVLVAAHPKNRFARYLAN
jgi:hypothetical protein